MRTSSKRKSVEEFLEATSTSQQLQNYLKKLKEQESNKKIWYMNNPIWKKYTDPITGKTIPITVDDVKNV